MSMRYEVLPTSYFIHQIVGFRFLKPQKKGEHREKLHTKLGTKPFSVFSFIFFHLVVIDWFSHLILHL
jgi:hypothetical protein